MMKSTLGAKNKEDIVKLGLKDITEKLKSYGKDIKVN